jgi:hypothetical protein
MFEFKDGQISHTGIVSIDERNFGRMNSLQGNERELAFNEAGQTLSSLAIANSTPYDGLRMADKVIADLEEEDARSFLKGLHADIESYRAWQQKGATS